MSLKHAILALLDIEPGSGYDLAKRFKYSIGHFWSSTHQQVYQELHKLTHEGAVEYQEVTQAGKPKKKIYTITDAGLNKLTDWARKPATPFKVKDPLLIKLFAGRNVPTEQLLDELAVHEELHRETLQHYLDSENTMDSLTASQKQKYLLPYMTLRLGIHFERAWLAWVEEVTKELKKLRTEV